MSNRQGIEIDYCPECRGVWLDRGELDKIIERSVADERPKTHHDERLYDDRRKHEKPYRDDDDYRYKKRKSVWGELFDF